MDEISVHDRTDKISIDKQKKSKGGVWRNFYTNFDLKGGIGMDFMEKLSQLLRG